jgi:hypothetical protein
VAKYVREKYKKLTLQKAGSHASQLAISNPEAWQNRFRELIAADQKRVAAIIYAPNGGPREPTARRRPRHQTAMFQCTPYSSCT